MELKLGLALFRSSCGETMDEQIQPGMRKMTTWDFFAGRRGIAPVG
jgi:hypothetical protein